MRRTVLIVPGLVQEPGGESVLRQKLPTLQALSDLGNTFRLSPLPNVETPEALYLGMPPTEGQLRQGPLTVAALGADPPERSTHFHLSLLSLDEDRVVKPTHMPTPEEGRILFERAKLLNTRTLTVLQGEELDHALVWEGLGDFETHAPGTELSYAKHRPEGDAEVLLRRLIDDSVNLLSDLELNQRRIDEGLQPFNILWPWGHGRRVPVRNLALTRAEPAMVESASLRMAGLSRLVGYSHVDRASVGRGLRTRFSQIAARCRQRDLSIVVMDVEGLTLEEKDWFVRELDRELLSPLLDDLVKDKRLLCLLCPAEGEGLGLSTASRPTRPLPFDERAFEESGVATYPVWEAIEQAVRRPKSADE